MKIPFVLGSNSDEKRVIPDIDRFIYYHPGVAVLLDIASADNTPEKIAPYGVLNGVVDQFELEHGLHAVVAGAGLRNALAAALRGRMTIVGKANKGEGYNPFQDLVVALPLSDDWKATSGLSSITSGCDTPPLNPSIAVGLDNSYAALNLAHRFNRGRFSGVCVAGGYDISDKIMEEAQKRGMRPTLVTGDVTEDVIMITPYTHNIRLTRIDSILRNGVGVQIAVYNGPATDLEALSHGLDGLEVTGQTSPLIYKNAVMMAAQFLQDPTVLAGYLAEKQKKTETLMAIQQRVFGREEAE